jgi:tetratricopeptide (TPR) repeat protein
VDYFLRGDLAKAKTQFTEVLKSDPLQMDLYLKLAEIALKEGNDDDALHWLERARLFDMRNVDILLREAEIYQRMKRFDETIRVLNRIIGLDETNLKALKSLREIYLNSQRWEEAIHTQKTILKLAKGKQAEEEESLCYLGLKYEHARDLVNRGGEENLETALKAAKEIVREDKTFQPGFVLLGDIYLRMGRWTSAGKVWGKSFRRFKSIIFILRLEELYLGREDPSTLLRIYQRALSSDPDNWMIAFFYTKLCLRLEMLDEALDEINEIKRTSHLFTDFWQRSTSIKKTSAERPRSLRRRSNSVGPPTSLSSAMSAKGNQKNGLPTVLNVISGAPTRSKRVKKSSPCIPHPFLILNGSISPLKGDEDAPLKLMNELLD